MIRIFVFVTLLIAAASAMADPGVGEWTGSARAGGAFYAFSAAVNSEVLSVQDRSEVCFDTDAGTSTAGSARVSMYRALDHGSPSKADSIAMNYIPYLGEACLLIDPGVYWIEVDAAATGAEDPVVIVSPSRSVGPGEYTNGYAGRRVVFTHHVGPTASQEEFIAFSNPVGSGVAMVIERMWGTNHSSSVGMSIFRGSGDPVSDGAVTLALCFDNNVNTGDDCTLPAPHNGFYTDPRLGQPNFYEWLPTSTNVVTPANASHKRLVYGVGSASDDWALDFSENPIIVYPGEWIGAFDSDSSVVNPLANILITFGIAYQERPIVE